MTVSEKKTCQNCKTEFQIESADFDFYKKISVPPPTWCWRCRAMRRMAFRNMTCLYPRTCAATGKKIFISMPPSAPMPVYDSKYWLSDVWDALEYGRDYDFSRPFFDQIKELYNAVPWGMIWNIDSVNSEYSSAAYAKNCYLCFDAGFDEDSAYSVSLQRGKNCFDVINCKYCELCYYSINTSHSFKVFFSRNCTSCSEVWFSQDCVGCTNCFGCTGLRNKNYHIFNQPYSKEAYKEKLKEFKLDSWTGIQNARNSAEAFWLQNPVKFQHSVQAKGCTGDYLFNSTELRTCFFGDGAQNCGYSQSIIYAPIKDCMDISSTGEAVELAYETSCSGDTMSKVFFSYDIGASTNLQYCINSRGVNNAFGCVGIRKKNYCILNKQYSKEEYNELVPKIIKHMSDMPYVDAKGRAYKYGEFFPPEMSPFGFNTTQGQEYFPISKEEAEERGFNWRETEKREFKVTKTPDALPDSILEIKDDIFGEVIQCTHDAAKEHPFGCDPNCVSAFKITPQELQFYRQMNLPLPRTCFYCRHFERISWRNKPKLYKGKCACLSSEALAKEDAYQNVASHFHGLDDCPNEFETTYPPDRPEIVYCEACYQSEVA